MGTVIVAVANHSAMNTKKDCCEACTPPEYKERRSCYLPSCPCHTDSTKNCYCSEKLGYTYHYCFDAEPKQECRLSWGHRGPCETAISDLGKDIGTYAKDHGFPEKESSDKDALYYRSEGYIDGYAVGLEDGKKEAMEEWKARYNSPDYKSDFDRFCGENPIESTEPVQEVSRLNTSFTEKILSEADDLFKSAGMTLGDRNTLIPWLTSKLEEIEMHSSHNGMMAERTRIISLIEKRRGGKIENQLLDQILGELRTETAMQNVEEQIGNAEALEFCFCALFYGEDLLDWILHGFIVCLCLYFVHRRGCVKMPCLSCFVPRVSAYF